jgi:SAM-dependent methyltransferase
MDWKRAVKKVLAGCRQYLGRLAVTDRYLRGEGIEIGALQDPLPLPKGTRARYLDIASTAELRSIYARKRRRHLVEVELVDDGERMATVADESTDFVASNHFLEHCEDPIGALRHMLRVVRTGGVVYLSVPDKRFIFDRDRPATTLAHLMQDHEQGPTGSRAAHYEEVAAVCTPGGAASAVRAVAAELRAQDFRIHFHCWTQLELLELLLALQRRPGFPAFELEHFSRNEAELVAVLRKGSVLPPVPAAATAAQPPAASR